MRSQDADVSIVLSGKSLEEDVKHICDELQKSRTSVSIIFIFVLRMIDPIWMCRVGCFDLCCWWLCAWLSEGKHNIRTFR
jgi:hypothetical protein